MIVVEFHSAGLHTRLGKAGRWSGRKWKGKAYRMGELMRVLRKAGSGTYSSWR